MKSKNMTSQLRDQDGILVFDEMASDLLDLRTYSLTLDMLLNRFGPGSLEKDMVLFFEILSVLNNDFADRLRGLHYGFERVYDFLNEDIPLDDGFSAFGRSSS